MLNENYFEKLRIKWLTKKIKCSKVEDQQDGIAVGNIGGVFVVIIVGIILAIFTLIFEYFWFKYHKKPIKPIDSVEYGESSTNVMYVSHSNSATHRTKMPIQASFRSRTVSNIQIGEMN